MKIVINRDYGGFYVPNNIVKELGYRNYLSENLRSDLRLVKIVEENEEKFDKLLVVEIPKEATDYKIIDYDGKESVIYVVDGKLHRAPSDWWCLEL